MHSETPEGFCSIPSATGGIARLACARLRELGKDAAGILAQVGARPEQVNDDAVRLEVPKQIRIQNFRMVFSGFISPAISISAKSG